MIADQMAGDAASVGSGSELRGEPRAKWKRYRTARMGSCETDVSPALGTAETSARE
ncbi:hypothetical protein ACVWXO_000715 [Bradyrhizobium sp. LM2.7]